jgi:magnesium transporter
LAETNVAEAEHLTLAFLDGHPAEAARVVDGLSAEQVAALFATISPHLGGPVISAMLPTTAARVLARLDERTTLALLSAAGAQAAVGILRHTPEPQRSHLIACLPPTTSVATQLLLGFPDDAVGAWTDPEVVALRPDIQAQAALAAVRTSEVAEIDAVYLVDGAQRLRGVLSLSVLLRAPDTTPISQLAQPPATTLAPMMPIAAAAGLHHWQRTTALPVVDHEQRLLGVLRRSGLALATQTRARAESGRASAASVTGVLAGGYWAVVAGLTGAALSLLPPVQRVRSEER